MDSPKAKIRKGGLYNRKLLSEPVWKSRVDLANANVLRLVDELGLQCCHLFLPIKRNKEIDTWALADRLTAKGIKVQVSVSDFENFKMSHFAYSDQVQFELNQFKIPEPVDALPADINEVDAVLIPLLATDKLGNRIGYGKGFYDRLLAGMHSSVIKIGVNLNPPFDAFPFAESHDVRLDYYVSPFKTYNCHE